MTDRTDSGRPLSYDMIDISPPQCRITRHLSVSAHGRRWGWEWCVVHHWVLPNHPTTIDR